MLNEIDKMIFCSEAAFLRFLIAADFNKDRAFSNFKAFIAWRKDKQVNQVLDNEEIPETKIKSLFPNTWYHTDKDNRPLWVI